MENDGTPRPAGKVCSMLLINRMFIDVLWLDRHQHHRLSSPRAANEAAYQLHRHATHGTTIISVFDFKLACFRSNQRCFSSLQRRSPRSHMSLDTAELEGALQALAEGADPLTTPIRATSRPRATPDSNRRDRGALSMFYRAVFDVLMLILCVCHCSTFVAFKIRP